MQQSNRTDPEYREQPFRLKGASAERLAEFRGLCARALERQTVEYAVSPGQSITTRGGLRGAYDEVTLADLDDGIHPPDLMMQELVTRGVVLAKKAGAQC